MCKGQTCPGGAATRGCGNGRTLDPWEVGFRGKMRKGEGIMDAGKEGGRETGRQGTDLSGPQISKCHSYKVFVLA